MLEFDTFIWGSELPVGLGVVGIAVVLPGGDFIDEGLFVGHAAVEALRRQDAELGLRHLGLYGSLAAIRFDKIPLSL
jgi:hypothetical protein